jgi:hypothetical protein
MADRTLRAIITGSSASAVRAFEETALASERAGSKIGTVVEQGSLKAGNALTRLGQTAGSFGIPFAGSLTMIGQKFDSTATKGQKFGTAISQIGKVSLVAGVAGLAAFGGTAIKLGSALDDAQASLKAAITATGQSMTKWQGPIAATGKTMESLGFTTAETDQALSHSVISTQDVGRSLSTMGLAADLARVKHESLTNATDALDKALTGNLRPLRQMGIDLPITASSALKLQTANEGLTRAQGELQAILQAVPGAADAGSAAHGRYEAALLKVYDAQAKVDAQSSASGQILDALTQRLGGQAAAAAETLRGKTEVLKAQLSDMGATIGQFLIPKLSDVVGFLGDNKAAMEALALIIGAVLGAAITVFAVEKVTAFVRGVGSMITSLANFARAMTATAATTEAEGAAIEGATAGIGGGFSALLGPIAAVTAGVGLMAYAIAKTHGQTVFGGDQGSPAENAKSVRTVLNPNARNLYSQVIGTSASGQSLEGKTPTHPFGINQVTGQPNPDPNAIKNQTAQLLAAQKAAEQAASRDAIAQAGAGAAHAAAAGATNTHATALNNAATAAANMQQKTDAVKASVDTLVKDSLTRANTALKDAQTAYTNFAQSTASAVTSTFSFGDAEKASSAAGGYFLDSLANQAGSVNDFTSKVKLLIQNGLSKDALQQVLAAGTQAGDDIATQLLNGGATAIGQANQMTAAVQNAATSLGTSAADEFYGAGVAQAQSIVKGITEESKRLAPKLKTASEKIAENLKTQVEVDLRIISRGGKPLPKFDSGGLVPGPPGSPMLAVVHGGETVIPANTSVNGGGGTANITINVNGGDPQAVVNALRQYVRTVGTLKSAGVA